MCVCEGECVHARGGHKGECLCKGQRECKDSVCARGRHLGVQGGVPEAEWVCKGECKVLCVCANGDHVCPRGGACNEEQACVKGEHVSACVCT